MGKLELQDAFLLLARWAEVKAWGRVTVQFKNGEPVSIEQQPHVQDRRQMRTFFPRLETEDSDVVGG